MTQDELKEEVNYDSKTGKFTWKKRSQGRRLDKFGCVDNGYIRVEICGRFLYAHRLAWLYMTGEYPENYVDHINGNRSDNRWCNLRHASHKENLLNRGATKENLSGYKGVHTVNLVKSTKYSASITVDQKHFYLGIFDTAIEASEAYEAKAKELHGEFYYKNKAVNE